MDKQRRPASGPVTGSDPGRASELRLVGGFCVMQDGHEKLRRLVRVEHLRQQEAAGPRLVIGGGADGYVRGSAGRGAVDGHEYSV